MAKKARTTKSRVKMAIKEAEFAEQTILVQMMLAVLSAKLDEYFKLMDDITEPGEEDYSKNFKQILLPIRDIEAALNKLVDEA